MDLDGALYPFQKPLPFGPRVLPNEAPWWTEQRVQVTVLTEDTAKKRRWLRSKPSWREMELLSQNICDGKKCESSMSTQTRKRSPPVMSEHQLETQNATSTPRRTPGSLLHQAAQPIFHRSDYLLTSTV